MSFLKELVEIDPLRKHWSMLHMRRRMPEWPFADHTVSSASNPSTRAQLATTPSGEGAVGAGSR
jgi:hypothetical protein